MKAEIFGFIGGFLTSVGFVPQIIKGLKTRKMDDVALWQYILLAFGMSCWFSYGLLITDWPLIIANGFSLACCILILYMKFRFSTKVGI